MIELQYPDKISLNLLQRINQLVDAGYLHFIETDHDDDYHDHLFCVNDGLNHLIRVGDDHYFELTIAEYDGPTTKSEVLVTGSKSYDRCRNITDDDVSIEIIEFESSDAFLENVTHEDAKLFAFSLNEKGKTGWRLPTYTECQNHFTYVGYPTVQENYFYWTNDDFWCNRNPVFAVEFADVIAVRCEVLVVV
jgi:hypothetical protein